MKPKTLAETILKAAKEFVKSVDVDAAKTLKEKKDIDGIKFIVCDQESKLIQSCRKHCGVLFDPVYHLLRHSWIQIYNWAQYMDVPGHKCRLVFGKEDTLFESTNDAIKYYASTYLLKEKSGDIKARFFTMGTELRARPQRDGDRGRSTYATAAGGMVLENIS